MYRHVLVIILTLAIIILTVASGQIGYGIAACLLSIAYFTIGSDSAVGGAVSAADKIYRRARTGHKTEALVRHYLNESCSDGKFLTTPLDWLRVRDESANDLVQLELDGYNPELNIAFEYNGPQHYTKPDADIQKWYVARYNDMKKREMCEAHGTPLIILHYGIDRSRLKDYARSRLKDLGALKPDLAFEYIELIPEQKIDDADIINSIIGVRRFGDGAPIFKHRAEHNSA